jgi:hypothetical protein
MAVLVALAGQVTRVVLAVQVEVVALEQTVSKAVVDQVGNVRQLDMELRQRKLCRLAQ